MKIYMPIIAFLIHCALLMPAFGGQPIDQEITKTLNTLLQKESDIPTKRFKVSTEDKVIVLNGIVDTRLQADKIVEIAYSIDNVKDVDTYNLKVTNSKQYLTDALLTSAVRGKIISLTRNNKIGKNKIYLETTNGCVHLFGTIDDEQDISIIKRETNRIKGVKGVHCNIESIVA